MAAILEKLGFRGLAESVRAAGQKRELERQRLHDIAKAAMEAISGGNLMDALFERAFTEGKRSPALYQQNMNVAPGENSLVLLFNEHQGSAACVGIYREFSGVRITAYADPKKKPRVEHTGRKGWVEVKAHGWGEIDISIQGKLDMAFRKSGSMEEEKFDIDFDDIGPEGSCSLIRRYGYL